MSHSQSFAKSSRDSFLFAFIRVIRGLNFGCGGDAPHQEITHADLGMVREIEIEEYGDIATERRQGRTRSPSALVNTNRESI